MEESRAVIELHHVTKDYGDFLLDDVSLTVPEGCICGFVGQNGAGKTTTLQLILDIIRQDSGEIRVFGQDMHTHAKALKDRIGVVWDEMGFHDFMTCLQINNMLKHIYSEWDEARFFGYLKHFSLPAKKKCGTFSRGMRMKLQIAAAMSHHAKLLIMDEPTSGLDPIVRSEIIALFQEYVCEEDHTILFSSHITSDLERIADELIFIDRGRILLSGNKDEILDTRGLIKCGRSDAGKIDKADIVSARSSQFGTEILVEDRQACKKKYPGLPIEPASLDDIMIFYVSRSGSAKPEGAE